MDTIVFWSILLAAVLHGGWNVLVKLNLDRFLSLFLIQSLMGLAGLVMLLAYPFPAAASWPHVFASGVLHTGYNLFLARSYRTGDLSQVYPVARGTAPLLTFIGAWAIAGEGLPPVAGAAVLILIGGIWITSLGGKRHLRLDRRTLFYALGTALFIGAYTLVDGLGARLSNSPAGYAGAVFVIDAAFMLATGLFLRGPGIFAAVAPFWKLGTAGALMSAAAYWIALWAMTQAPIAAVAALRETSILFVIAASALVLKEPVGAWRWFGGGLILAGAAALRFA